MCKQFLASCSLSPSQNEQKTEDYMSRVVASNAHGESRAVSLQAFTTQVGQGLLVLVGSGQVSLLVVIVPPLPKGLLAFFVCEEIPDMGRPALFYNQH